jgi:hypothetical protein
MPGVKETTGLYDNTGCLQPPKTVGWKVACDGAIVAANRIRGLFPPRKSFAATKSGHSCKSGPVRECLHFHHQVTKPQRSKTWCLRVCRGNTIAASRVAWATLGLVVNLCRVAGAATSLRPPHLNPLPSGERKPDPFSPPREKVRMRGKPDLASKTSKNRP